MAHIPASPAESFLSVGSLGFLGLTLSEYLRRRPRPAKRL